MTGSPLLRLALVFAGLVLLAIPAWRLTGRETAEEKAVTVVEKKPAAAQLIQLVFASPQTPSEIVVTAHGKTVATLNFPEGPWWVEVPLSLPPEGLDLIIQATWPEKTWPDATNNNALRVQARAGLETIADTTLWGDSPIEDVVTLTGSPTP